ncbi:glycoprotein [Rhodococcus tibetensis]|uniref:Glycoprotein n=1 Tax=Rhodococcus tibetensis TaxID=2965064 RepID=A0ABT1QEG0_9NOCA|nr:glycoprotein [Rhodococcus sp. FXJ9.536]MCQ4119485.1 glycoprotein [Rhodococcus sp. FXJ9.536]
MHALAAALSVSAAAALGAATAHAAPTTAPSTSQPGVTDPSTPPTTSQPGVTDPSTPPTTSQPGVTEPSAPAPTAPAPPQAPLAVPGAAAVVPEQAGSGATPMPPATAGAGEAAPAQPAAVWIDPDDMPKAHQAPVAPALPVPKPVVEVNAAADTLIGALPLAVNGRQYGNPEGYVGTIGWRIGDATGTAGIAVDPSSPTAAAVSAFVADSNAEHPTNWSAPVDVTPIAAAVSDAADRYPAFGQVVDAIAALPAPQLPQLQSTDNGPSAVTIGGVNLRSQATLHV